MMTLHRRLKRAQMDIQESTIGINNRGTGAETGEITQNIEGNAVRPTNYATCELIGEK